MSYPRIVIRRNTAKSNTPKSIDKSDVIKLCTFFISLLGITAWVSGAAFDAGYWGMAGLESGLTVKSLQQTALTGFIGAFRTWITGTAIIGIIGILICLFSIGIKKETSSATPKWVSALRNWFNSKFTYDKSSGTLGLSITVGVYFFFFCFLIPLALWSVGAHDEGVQLFQKQVCSVRAGKSIATTVQLGERAGISGRLIDRSENTAIVLDGKSLHFVKLGDKPQLLYSLALPAINCPKTK